MKHTVEMKSGRQAVYEFESKAKSNQALKNAIHLNKTFNAIKCIWVEPINHPEEKTKIDFDEMGCQINTTK